MVLSWGKMNVGHSDGGRRLRRLAEQVQEGQQEGQQEELWGPMEQGEQLGQRLGERAARGAEEMRERGWKGAEGQGQWEVELPGPGADSGGVAEQGGQEEEVCRRWTPQVLQRPLRAAGGVCEHWHEHVSESEPEPGQLDQG